MFNVRLLCVNDLSTYPLLHLRLGAKMISKTSASARTSHRPHLLLAAGLLVVATISPAYGQSVFEIDDAQITTNGGATLDGDDTILVTDQGNRA